MSNGKGVFIIGRFVDDYGNDLVPLYLLSFPQRYWFYTEG